MEAQESPLSEHPAHVAAPFASRGSFAKLSPEAAAEAADYAAEAVDGAEAALRDSEAGGPPGGPTGPGGADAAPWWDDKFFSGPAADRPADLDPPVDGRAPSSRGRSSGGGRMIVGGHQEWSASSAAGPPGSGFTVLGFRVFFDPKPGAVRLLPHRPAVHALRPPLARALAIDC